MPTIPEDDRPASWQTGTCGRINWQVRVASKGALREPSHPIRVLFARGHFLNEALPASGSGPGWEHRQLETLYLRHGHGQLSRLLEGDLSFALWDGRAMSLVLSTDRLGLHPIYYYRHSDRLFVSWKVEDLVPYLPDSQPDMRSLSAHVAGFLLPEGRTFYDGIQRIPAGMIARVYEDDLEQKKYWSLEGSRPAPRDAEACAGELNERLREVHRSWLRVLPAPVGIALSSGLDSGSVAAVVRGLDSSPLIRAFSWVHPGLPEADESAGIEDVCRTLNLDLTRIEADRHWTLCDPQGLTTSIQGPEAHYYRESWEVTFQRAKSQGHHYLFSGVGGDELFGGISSYTDLFLCGRWFSLLRQLLRERRDAGFGPRYIFSSTLNPWLRNRFPRWQLRRMRLPVWLTEATRERVRGLLLPPFHSRRGDFGRQLRIRFLQNLARSRQILQVSRIGEVAGLGMIHPLLDRRVVEFAASLPATQNFHAGKDKMILRRAFQEILPAPIIQRKRKITVETLFHRGLRERETAKVWPLLQDMRAADLGLVDQASVRHQYRQYLKGEGSALGIWNALTVEDWLRRYF